MNAILENITINTKRELKIWPHQEMLSSIHWSEMRASWKKNNKDIHTKDLLFYFILKSANKEIFFHKFYKGFTPLKNSNKLKDNHPYSAGLYAILDLKSDLEMMINFYEKSPVIDRESFEKKFKKHHQMFYILGNNREMIENCILWLSDLYKEVYNK